MRKLAPVFIAASVLAISSTAFAFGDKRDNKAAPSTNATTMPSSMSNPASAPMKSSSYTAPAGAPAVPATGASDATTSGSSAGAAGSMGSGTATSSYPAPGNTTGGTPAVPATGASDATTAGSSKGAAGSMSSGMAPDKSTSKPKGATASNDANRCDPAQYTSGTTMPKDCLDGAKGGAAVGSTQGQSGK